MNEPRRKVIDNIINALAGLQTDIEFVTSEEEDALESVPGGLQDGERGQKMQEAIDDLESAVDSIGEAIAYLEAAKVNE